MKKVLSLIALVIVSLTIADAQTEIVAHRGYWDTEGSYENTLTSLKKAGELGIYGSELDVWITTDGVVVVHHDPTIQGHRIETSSYDELKNLVLPNGEKLPTLEAYLEVAAKIPDMKLVLELKSHKRVVNEDRVTLASVYLVKKYQLEDRIDYISFSMNICKNLIRLLPAADVYYLNGEVSPVDLKALGFAGSDYHYNVFKDHPGWIKESHDLGLKVNVWTVNDKEMMQSFIDQGVDFITTNDPVGLKVLLKK